MKKTVLAIIGCGRIARNAHLPALSILESVRIKYACDCIESKAVALKKDFSIVELTVLDYKTVLQDEEVEAVYVLTPNFMHYTIAMEALRAGKHVFCEKPITINYELSRQMSEEAKKQNKILQIGVCNRYNKSVEMLEQYVKEGKFGNIYHVYCSFRNFRNIPGLGGAFTTKSQSGGGVLIDWGVHFLDLILYVLGGAKIKTVTCDAYCEMAKDMEKYKYDDAMWAEDTANIKHGTNDVDDFITGYVRTDKASISFNGAWAQNLNENEMYIDFLGDKGGVRLTYGGKFEFCDGSTLETVRPEYDIPNMYLQESKAFLESVKSGKENKSNIVNVLETAKLLDILYVSADKKKEVLL